MINYYTKILPFVVVLVAFSLRTCTKDTGTSEIVDITSKTDSKIDNSTADTGSFEECSEITRGVLITHCGSCHQSSLESHKTGAIKVFDLDKKVDWHTSLALENLEGITSRTKNKSSISDLQKEAIATFLELKALQLKE
ncbi:hypothetical protein U6A24_13280 [Aquimarina gracilis]|uniref:Cytochrome c domain-containing protein n=1 Tax=Aquimarina gracilis TaxID=874422 RepID=A0ABU5ZX70_9FLAO|nr:hypothetical protein [Aquimarina gracilis]MEB3346443.1 hypothetical protein [Aquimarina gracilis]